MSVLPIQDESLQSDNLIEDIGKEHEPFEVTRQPERGKEKSVLDRQEDPLQLDNVMIEAIEKGNENYEVGPTETRKEEEKSQKVQSEALSQTIETKNTTQQSSSSQFSNTVNCPSSLLRGIQSETPTPPAVMSQKTPTSHRLGLVYDDTSPPSPPIHIDSSNIHSSRSQEAITTKQKTSTMPIMNENEPADDASTPNSGASPQIKTEKVFWYQDENSANTHSVIICNTSYDYVKIVDGEKEVSNEVTRSFVRLDPNNPLQYATFGKHPLINDEFGIQCCQNVYSIQSENVDEYWMCLLGIANDWCREGVVIKNPESIAILLDMYTDYTMRSTAALESHFKSIIIPTDPAPFVRIASKQSVIVVIADKDIKIGSVVLGIDGWASDHDKKIQLKNFEVPFELPYSKKIIKIDTFSGLSLAKFIRSTTVAEEANCQLLMTIKEEKVIVGVRAIRDIRKDEILKYAELDSVAFKYHDCSKYSLVSDEFPINLIHTTFKNMTDNFGKEDPKAPSQSDKAISVSMAYIESNMIDSMEGPCSCSIVGDKPKCLDDACDYRRFGISCPDVHECLNKPQYMEHLSQWKVKLAATGDELCLCLKENVKKGEFLCAVFGLIIHKDELKQFPGSRYIPINWVNGLDLVMIIDSDGYRRNFLSMKEIGNCRLSLNWINKKPLVTVSAMESINAKEVLTLPLGSVLENPITTATETSSPQLKSKDNPPFKFETTTVRARKRQKFDRSSSTSISTSNLSSSADYYLRPSTSNATIGAPVERGTGGTRGGRGSRGSRGGRRGSTGSSATSSGMNIGGVSPREAIDRPSHGKGSRGGPFGGRGSGKEHPKYEFDKKLQRYKCPKEDCNSTFDEPTKVRAHVAFVHGDPLVCKKCGTLAKSKYLLQRHMIEVHAEGQKPIFKCDKCGSTYSRKYRLVNHHCLPKNVRLESSFEDTEEVEESGLFEVVEPQEDFNENN